jgi:hypothetical protein
MICLNITQFTYIKNSQNGKIFIISNKKLFSLQVVYLKRH